MTRSHFARIPVTWRPSTFTLFFRLRSIWNRDSSSFTQTFYSNRILQGLISTNRDIVLAVDNSYQYHKHEVDKKLDLAVSKEKRHLHHRRLHPTTVTEIARIGPDIEFDEADFEFIGMAYFSKPGVNLLRDLYHQCLHGVKGRF